MTRQQGVGCNASPPAIDEGEKRGGKSAVVCCLVFQTSDHSSLHSLAVVLGKDRMID